MIEQPATPASGSIDSHASANSFGSGNEADGLSSTAS